MRIKCKECQRFIGGICSWYQRRRSSGKKRFCFYFARKFVERKEINVVRMPFRTRAERKKEEAKKIFERGKLKEMERMIEQEKLKRIAVVPSSYETPKMVVKEGVFKKIRRRLCGS